jgi:hypothetical protein
MTRPTLTEKLDATLLALLEAQGRAFDREAAKLLQAGDIAKYFDFDHYPVPKANGGGNHPTNLVPMLRPEHQVKTARIDTPRIAKGKRLSKAQKAHCAVVAAKVGQIADAEAERTNQENSVLFSRSRRLPCGKDSGWKKPLNGNAVRRCK